MTTPKENEMTNWKHYRTALEFALDSVGRFDVLTPEEVDKAAESLAVNVRSMALRDEFAAKAMQGILSNPEILARHGFATVDVARGAYDYADAMLIARDETVEKIEEAG